MKKINFILLFFAFFITSFLLVSKVEASSYKNAEQIHITENEIVEGNLYVGAIDLIVDGNIGGDLIGFAENITINGEIAGDLIVVASALEVNGRVEGNIRSLANSFNFNGFAGRNITSFGEKINTSEDSVVAWDLLTSNRETNLKGLIKGNLDSRSDNINLSNITEKNAKIKVNNDENSFYLSPGASIEGDLDYYKTEELNLKQGENEVVKGNITYNKVDNSKNVQLFFIDLLLRIMGAILIAFLLVFGFKKITQGVLKSLASFKNKDIIPGALFLMISPIIAFFFFITLFGIPFSFLIMSFYFIAIYLSQLFFGIFIGDLIYNKINKNKNYFLFVSLGIALSFAAFSLPYLGSFIAILVVLFTLSGIIKYARN